jgi:hypothetical protein
MPDQPPVDVERSMEIRQLVIQLMSKNLTEYLSESPVGLFPIPRIYPPAQEEQIAALERRAGQRLDAGYREFLSLTDGMDGFQLDMPVFGCRDWNDGGRAFGSLRVRDETREDGTPADVGLPEDIELFPVSVDTDHARAIFMIEAPEVLPERFWWVGGGSSSFFGTFADLLAYAIDPRTYSPRETVD